MEDYKGVVVIEFEASAAEFCKLLEEASSMRTGDLFGQLQQNLPVLYQRSARLTKPKYCYEEEPKHFVSEEDYAQVHDALQQKIELYFGITQMSPGTGPSQYEIMSFSIAEGFTDLYEELKNFVKLYEIGIPQAMNDAVWIYQHNFQQAFGVKLIDCLKSLHQLLYNKSADGARAVQEDDFGQSEDEDEPWYSDDQEEIYGDGE